MKFLRSLSLFPTLVALNEIFWANLMRFNFHCLEFTFFWRIQWTWRKNCHKKKQRKHQLKPWMSFYRLTFKIIFWNTFYFCVFSSLNSHNIFLGCRLFRNANCLIQMFSCFIWLCDKMGSKQQKWFLSLRNCSDEREKCEAGNDQYGRNASVSFVATKKHAKRLQSKRPVDGDDMQTLLFFSKS